MDRHHPHAEPGRRFHGAGDGVRDIVEFQIEKNPVALIDETPYQGRTLSGEELAAHLESADAPAQPGRHFDGLDGVVDVERD